MKKIALVLLLIPFSLYAEEQRDYRLMDWRKGTLSDDLTFSKLAIEEYQDSLPASLKLKTKGPVFFREEWTPPRSARLFAVGDLDRDGDMDMIIQESSYRTYSTITAYEKTRKEPYDCWKKREDWGLIISENEAFPRLIDFDGDGDCDLFVGRKTCYFPPYSTLEVSAYENIGTGGASIWNRRTDWEPPPFPVAATMTIKLPVCSIPAPGDLDGDSDIDLAIAGINDVNMGGPPPPGYLQPYVCFWRNDGTRSSPFWNKPEWDLTGQAYKSVSGTMHGPLFNLIFFDRDGDSRLDVAMAEGEFIFWYKNIGSLTSPLWEEYGRGLYSRRHNALPYINVGDIDSDGYLEFLYGDFGNLVYVLDVDSSNPDIRYRQKYKWEKEGEKEVANETCPSFVDINQDGDYDMCWGNGNSCNGDWAIGITNVGCPESPSFYSIKGITIIWYFYRPTDASYEFGQPIIPRPVDLDSDSDFDMVFGDAAGNLNAHQNIGTAGSPTFKRDPSLDLPRISIFGYAASPAFADMDNDSDYDAFVVETHIFGTRTAWYYENIGTRSSPSWKKRQDLSFTLLRTPSIYVGVPILEDLDQDGDYDLIVGMGGVDGTLLFYENIGSPTSFRFSINPSWKIPWEGPFECPKPAFADIDNDGDLDLFLGNNPGDCTIFENIGDHYTLGTYTSSILPKKDYKRIFWNETIPYHTSLNLSIRTGNTSSFDNSWSAWKEVKNGDDISCNSYLQYRVVLSTSEPKRSPILYETIFEYGIKQISLSPQSGMIGTEVTVRGEGFPSKTPLTIRFGTTQTIASVLTNNLGSFSATFIVNTQQNNIVRVLAEAGVKSLTDYFVIMKEKKPDISLQKSYKKDGNILTYTINFENKSDGTATSVVIIDFIPEGCILKEEASSSKPSDISYYYQGYWNSSFSNKTEKIQWEINSIEPGEKGWIRFLVDIK